MVNNKEIKKTKCLAIIIHAEPYRDKLSEKGNKFDWIRDCESASLGLPRHDDQQLVRKQVFPRLRFPAFFLEIIHLQEVGREEDIDRRAFVDLPRKAAGRAEIEFTLCLDCG